MRPTGDQWVTEEPQIFEPDTCSVVILMYFAFVQETYSSPEYHGRLALPLAVDQLLLGGMCLTALAFCSAII